MYELSDTPDLMLGDERVLVRRRDAGLGDNTVIVDGVRVHRGFEAEFALSCTVQPVSGKELMQLEEGDRFDAQYWCYVADGEQPTASGDLIFRQADGLWYLVKDCENWEGSYTRIRMQELDVGPPPTSDLDPLAEYDRQLFVSQGN